MSENLDWLYEQAPFTLNQKQQDFLHHFINVNKGHAALIGTAGVGKSALMWLLKQYYGDEIIFMADTGVASLNMPDGIGIGTGHSILSLPTKPANELTYRKVSKKTQQILGASDKVKIIVIDEVFGYNSDTLDVIWRRIERYNKAGGKRKRRDIRLLVVGDPIQKITIAKPEMKRELAQRWGHHLMFCSKVWDRFKFTTYVLDQVERQEDKTFKACLDVIRYNQRHRFTKCLQWLNQRYTGTYPEEDLVLCATNKKVDEINNYFLERAEGIKMTYKPIKKGKFDMRDVLIREEGTTLCEGLRVMLVKNLPDKGVHMVNGLVGVVSLVESEGVWVDFEGGYKEFVGYELWENKDYYWDTEVDSDTGEQKEAMKEKTVGSLKAVPLLLSHAMTISKCQGLTIRTNFTIDLGWKGLYNSPQLGDFGTNLVYLAASRSDHVEKINLATKILPEHLKSSQDSINFWFKCVEDSVI